jgi:hypothetical protein
MSAVPSPEVGPSDDVPLSIEPVLGWRVWRLARRRGELTLVSMTRNDAWPAARSMRAACSGGHAAPGTSCRCGLYAADSVSHLAASGVFSNGAGVIGAIAMWGTVVEHHRGARSEYAYPARLRLVCGPCLREGRVADPKEVAGSDSWLVPMCESHLKKEGATGPPAAEVQSELLSAYAVELLPKPKISRLTLQRTPASVGLQVGKGIFAVIRFTIGALFMLWAFSGILLLALAIATGVLGAVFGWNHPDADPSATAAALAPSPSLVHADRTDLHRRQPPAPAVPKLAVKCGISHGTWIEFASCSSPAADLLGFAGGASPMGASRDCPPDPDAYSYGKDWNVCWLAAPNTWVSPAATSPNPFHHVRR